MLVIHCMTAVHVHVFFNVAAAHFAKLTKIKDILCDEVSRQKYNHWLCSGICISFEEWCARSAHCTVCPAFLIAE